MQGRPSASLHRERMQAESAAEPLQLLVGRSLQGQPDETALLDVLGEILVVGIDQDRNRQARGLRSTRLQRSQA